MSRFPFFLFSFAMTFLLCPPVRLFAKRIGAVDTPGGRHIHTAPTPRLGGLALACGMGAALLLGGNGLADPLLPSALFFGGGVILALGIRDDTRGLSPFLKISLQLTAALFAVFFGVRFEGMDNVAIPATLVWLLVMTNGYNLIDGLDGLCAGCGGMGGGAFALLGLLAGDKTVVAVSLALFGGCLGFLPHNLRQKKLFLGDTGAQLIGFCLGLLSLRVINGGGGISALCLVAYPLAETVTTVQRRLWHGQNPLKADRGHFHHRLTDRGLSHRQAAIVLLLLALFGTMGGILLPVSPSAAGWVIWLYFVAFLILLETEGIRRWHRKDIPQDSR